MAASVFPSVGVALPAPRSTPERYLKDPSGTVWHLYLHPPGVTSPDPARPTLVADGRRVIRRFWTFPVDWADWDDRELLRFIDGVRGAA